MSELGVAVVLVLLAWSLLDTADLRGRLLPLEYGWRVRLVAVMSVWGVAAAVLFAVFVFGLVRR